MITAPETKQAFDIASEDEKLRAAYGRNKFGQSCLLAGAETTGDPPPEDPPLGAAVLVTRVLDLVGEREAPGPPGSAM